MKTQELESIAQSILASNRGILAADESTGTIAKRFKAISTENTEDNRRAYRDLLFTTPDAAKYISGVILYDETIRQKAQNGTPFPELLKKLGIVPGIKVDEGAKALAGFPGETVTEGLGGLRERLAEYYALGARFAKWRAVITIEENIPTSYCMKANAHALARYAALCQEAGIVPIVEPEVLMDWSNTLERCDEVTTAMLNLLFSELIEHRVHLEGILLKPNMVISGKKCPRQGSVDEVAQATLRCLRRTVPAAVPGIVFLSGGQSPELATEHLNRMNQLGPHPWKLSFSYGRALQEPSLDAWQGNPVRVPAAQTAFHLRAKCNSAACNGSYTPAMEKSA